MRLVVVDIDRMERDLFDARESISRRANGDVEQYRCTQCELRDKDYDVVVDHVRENHDVEEKFIKVYIAEVFV